MTAAVGSGAETGTGRPAVGRVQLLAEIGLCGLAAAVAGLAWAAVFPRSAVLAPVLATAAGAAALTAITWSLHVPGPLAAALHLPAVAAALRMLVGGDASQIATGILRGWARVLDSSLPAGSSPDQRAIAPLATWAAAAVACGLVARTRRPWAHLWPLVASVVVVRVLATRGEEGSVLAAAAVGVVVLGGVLVAVRSQPTGSYDLPRLGPLGLVVAAGAVVGASLIPGAAPFDLSARRHPDRDQQPPTTSPLALLKAAQQDTSPLFTVDVAPHGAVPSDAGPLYLRLAVLDAYRAGDWAPTGAFQATGGRVPLPPAEPALSFELDQELVIEGLDGPWVPAADRPLMVASSPRPVRVDPVTGTIVVTDGLRPGDRFLVRSRVARADEASLLAARADPAHAAFGVPITGTPADLVELAAQWTQGTVSDFDRVASLQGHFATTFAVDDRAESGRSLSQLQRFIGVTQVGTSEQFATAFVVLARAVGLPARVAVGFRVPIGTTSTVAGNQLEAWPEVALADVQGRPLGWVPFDPAPKDTRPPDRQAPEPDEGAAAELAARVAADQTVAPPAGPPGVAPAVAASPWPRRLLALAGLLLLLGAGVPALVGAGRRRRTSARRRGSANARVAGAWAEALQALRDRGLGDQRASTVTEAVTGVERLEAIGPTAATHLASIGVALTRALFVDRDGVTDAEAEGAWAEASALRRLVARDRGVVDKVRAAYDVRVLIGR